MTNTVDITERLRARHQTPALRLKAASGGPGGSDLLPATVGPENAAPAASPSGSNPSRTPLPDGDHDHGTMGADWLDWQIARAARPRHRDTGVAE